MSVCANLCSCTMLQRFSAVFCFVGVLGSSPSSIPIEAKRVPSEAQFRNQVLGEGALPCVSKSTHLDESLSKKMNALKIRSGTIVLPILK